MTQVFISYSHKDKSFVQELASALQQKGIDPWVDWEDIRPTSEWWPEILKGIDASDAFLYVISPDSVKSEVCLKEIEHACLDEKRMIPLQRHAVEPTLLPKPIAERQWLSFTADGTFDQNLEHLLEALNLDLAWSEFQTNLLLRARDWEQSGKESSRELRGRMLTKAENWSAQADPASKRIVTSLQAKYLQASRKGAARLFKRVALLGIILTIGLNFLIYMIGQSLRNFDAPMGLTSLELAGTVQQAQHIVDSWSSLVLPRATLCVGLNFLFIICYAVTFIGSSLFFYINFNRIARKWALGGAIIACLFAITAVLDVIGNILLTAVLWDTISQASAAAKLYPLIAIVMTYKMPLIIIGISYLLIAMLWLNIILPTYARFMTIPDS